MTVSTLSQEAGRPAPNDRGRPGASAPDDITVRRLETLTEFLEACVIQDETWGPGFSERVPAAILNVAQRIGGVSAGAFAADGRLLGFVFGMTGFREGRIVHWSDMLAVRVEARGSHLGDRLKHFQRDCCLDTGVETMLWTFDPLVARNAHFNLNRLGARAAEYVIDMYGSNTGSTLHGDMPTDRMIAEWDLRAAPPLAEGARPGAEPRSDARAILSMGDDGTPHVQDAEGAAALFIEVPNDVGKLRARDPALPLPWRLAVRQALTSNLARGYHVTGFRRGTEAGSRPGYVLEPNSLPHQ